MTNGFQSTYWQGGGKRRKSKGTIPVYQCKKCALRFDNPTEYRDKDNWFRWCPCCQSPDFEYVGTAVVGTQLADTVMHNPVSEIEGMIALDVFLDGDLDGGFHGF